jgi:hypothetical protein
LFTLKAAGVCPLKKPFVAWMRALPHRLLLLLQTRNIDGG